MTPADARDAFTRLLQTPEPELDLAEAALLIAAEEYPDLRPSVYLEQIARMGTELKRRIRAEVEPRRVVETANTYLFEELHFKGNREEYYDPRNSFLNDVIERRVGIPITLAVLYIAIGERAGLPVRGVGMPGHFLVKYAPASSGEIFIDAFNGRTLSRNECAKMLEDMYGGTVKMRPALLEPSTKRQILARILNNLKSLYLSRGDLARALAASDRIMLTDPHLTSEWRDRGLIQFQMGALAGGISELMRTLVAAIIISYLPVGESAFAHLTPAARRAATDTSALAVALGQQLGLAVVVGAMIGWLGAWALLRFQPPRKPPLK